MIACGLTLLLNLNLLPDITYARRGLLIALALFSILFITSTYTYINFNVTKPLYSTFALGIMAASAFSFASYLERLSCKCITHTLCILNITLILLGWISLIHPASLFNYGLHNNAVFPFSETSHYALVAGFFFCVHAFLGKTRMILFVLLNSLALSLLHPSLLLLVFTVLLLFIILIRFKRTTFIISTALILPLVLTGIWLITNNMEYFSSRLNINNTDNLTTLVYLQGWERAKLNFWNSDGLGIGFQMLDSRQALKGYNTELIMHITKGNHPLNIADGGFLAAKTIAEFGLLGILLLVTYLIWLIKTPFYINKLYHTPRHTKGTSNYILAAAFLFSFGIEVFFRGYGYFSPGVFFATTALFLLRNAHPTLRTGRAFINEGRLAPSRQNYPDFI